MHVYSAKFLQSNFSLWRNMKLPSPNYVDIISNLGEKFYCNKILLSNKIILSFFFQQSDIVLVLY